MHAYGEQLYTSWYASKKVHGKELDVLKEKKVHCTVYWYDYEVGDIAVRPTMPTQFSYGMHQNLA